MEEAQTTNNNVIVVGTDLASAGADALREALRLSRKLPAPELHIVFALPVEGHGAEAIARLSGRVEKAHTLLSEHVKQVCQAEQTLPVSEIHLQVRVGDAAASVHQVAIDREADFIVVGTRKRSGVMRWLEGSVSQQLARIAHCPVIIAHPKDYQGLRRSEVPLPPRPGQEKEVVLDRDELHLPERTSHISGLL